MDDKIMAGVNREELIAWLRGSDGYAILEPRYFTKMGFPSDFVGRYTYNHQGGEGKHSITSHDGQDNAAWGVSCFEFIRGIMAACGTSEAREFFGRGSQFRSDCGQVLKALGEPGRS